MKINHCKHHQEKHVNSKPMFGFHPLQNVLQNHRLPRLTCKSSFDINFCHIKIRTTYLTRRFKKLRVSVRSSDLLRRFCLRTTPEIFNYVSFSFSLNTVVIALRRYLLLHLRSNCRISFFVISSWFSLRIFYIY